MKQLKKNLGGKDGRFFLGLDASTQSLKGLIIDQNARLVHEAIVNFDRDLPGFKTRDGIHRHADGLTVTSPPLMWIAALDLLLERFQSKKIPFHKIAAISGSGQQHGSVYLNRAAASALGGLDPKKSLRKQLADIFSVENSPIWMDSSTTGECKKRDRALGGPQAVAKLTGSRSYERFTGNQIAKIYRKFPAKYAATEHIALVSSFMASLLIGGYAPIDTADGAGMNLMDIRRRQWDKRALACTAPDLAAKLPPLIASHKPVGLVSDYMSKRYGFAPNTVVIAFSGDNPNSLAAFGLDRPGAITISLGTSDTVFGALSNPKPSAIEGHIFGNPIYPQGYMALLCYKNGSLTRESVRDTYARGSWDIFNRMLANTTPGNDGLIGFYYKEPEITPPVLKPGIFLFNNVGPLLAEAVRAYPPARARPGAKTARCKQRPYKDFKIPMHNAAPEQHVRAVLESQFMSMRTHCANIGLTARTIIATGGASVNKGILKIMADVFGRNISTIEQQNSAALGAALRALHGWRCLQAGNFIPFGRIFALLEKPEIRARPNPANHRIYTAMLPRFRKLESQIADSEIE